MKQMENHMPIDREAVCARVREIARAAGDYIAAERKRFTVDRVEVKGVHNFVSYVDKGAERMVVEALGALVPEAGFIAEEGSGRVDPAAPYQWIVDPLDGTTNFVHGLPPYAVSIALWDTQAKEAVVGVVYEVTLQENFYTWKGAPGAFCNGEPIRVSDVARVDDALVLTGLAYGLDAKVVEHFERSFAYFNRNSHGARRLGSAATDLVYVAAGRADAFYHINLSPWDVAAGAFIVRQAGGVVTDFAGGADYTFGRSVVATNPSVRDEVFRLVAGKEFIK
ncbi:inositol monophosphatase family protein [uncultured Rikenella sp.]|uniref:inositol monophosphatase family protein n=1 Tax=uncultured Rikenella sp. TaxID=368003 RepID=UPI0025DAAF1D|nr:inositol monophosphatase family protein [uncultured Rikenella sp.]